MKTSVSKGIRARRSRETPPTSDPHAVAVELKSKKKSSIQQKKETCGSCNRHDHAEVFFYRKVHSGPRIYGQSIKFGEPEIRLPPCRLYTTLTEIGLELGTCVLTRRYKPQQ